MVLDTNILIAYLNGEEKVIKMLSEWKNSGRALFISTIER
jgi:predicted nucleic acid-binding protein